MKINFIVAAADNTGGARVIAQYASGLMKLGHEVVVISPPHGASGRLNRLLDALFPMAKSRRKNHFEHLGVPIKMLNRFRPVRSSDVPDGDVLIATWWETAVWIKDFPQEKGKKIHFVQGYEIWNGQIEEVHNALRLQIPKVTISDWLASKIEHLGLDRPTVILNGVDHWLFAPVAQILDNHASVGFVFANSFQKGSDIALSAIKIAREIEPNIKVIAFGHVRPAQHMIDTEKISFIVSPEQTTLSEIYSSCSVWLFPSREEGFGLPILEALSCGTPVIACPAGAAPDILRHGGGSLLKTFEAEEMASEIIRYIKMSKEEINIKSQSALYTASKYSWDKSIKKFEQKILSVN